MAVARATAFRPELLWQSARAPLFWLDQALRVVWVNPAWESLTGCPAAKVVGLTCPNHGPYQEGDPSDLLGCFLPPAEARSGQPAGCRTLVLSAAGERSWKRIDFWPFQDQEGELIGLLGRVCDPEANPGHADPDSLHLRIRLLELRERSRLRYGIESLIGSGPAHDCLLRQVQLAAKSLVPVLITGEPGTGKRTLARIIHQLGAGAKEPLVPIDCEALPPEVLERELFTFPHEGEQESEGERNSPPHSNGALKMPSGSSLMIGDILALPRDMQARLVAALDGRVRLLATTAGDPHAALSKDLLLPALYHALMVLVLRVPPLRERRHEIAVLAQHFLERANRRGEVQVVGLGPRAILALEAYDWPGNLRELARVVDHAHAAAASRAGFAPNILIEPDHLPASIRGNLGAAYLPPVPSNPVKPLDELLTEIERRLIESALGKARQNKSRAAELLGISRPRLYRRIKELNLPDDPDPEIAGDSPLPPTP